MKGQDPQFRPPSSESLAAGYETSGVKVKALAWSVVALVITAAIVHAGAWYILVAFLRADSLTDVSYSGLSDQGFIQNYNSAHGTTLAAGTGPTVAAPRVQPSEEHNSLPRQDLHAMYVRENEVFREMGWSTDPNDPSRLEIPRAVVNAMMQQAGGKPK